MLLPDVVGVSVVWALGSPIKMGYISAAGAPTRNCCPGLQVPCPAARAPAATVTQGLAADPSPQQAGVCRASHVAASPLAGASLFLTRPHPDVLVAPCNTHLSARRDSPNGEDVAPLSPGACPHPHPRSQGLHYVRGHRWHPGHTRQVARCRVFDGREKFPPFRWVHHASVGPSAGPRQVGEICAPRPSQSDGFSCAYAPGHSKLWVCIARLRPRRCRG